MNDDISNIEKSFQDGCSTIAAKITSLGVNTAANASIDTIVNNIEKLYNSNLSKPLTFTLYSSTGIDYAYANVGSLFMTGRITLDIENYNLLYTISGTVNVTKTFSDGAKTTVSVTSGNNTSLSDVVSVTVEHSSSVCSADTTRSTTKTAKITIE